MKRFFRKRFVLLVVRIELLEHHWDHLQVNEENLHCMELIEVQSKPNSWKRFHRMKEEKKNKRRKQLVLSIHDNVLKLFHRLYSSHLQLIDLLDRIHEENMKEIACLYDNNK